MNLTKELYLYMKRLWGYKYCNACGWTEEEVYEIGRHFLENPRMMCRRCINKHKLQSYEKH